MLPLGEVELGPLELVAEVLVGPPAVGAHGGARGARAVNAVAHRAPAGRAGNGEDDTALLVDLALVGGHPAGIGAGAPLEDDLLAFLGRVVLADDGPLGAAGALHAVSGSDDAGQDRDPDGRLLLGGLLGGPRTTSAPWRPLPWSPRARSRSSRQSSSRWTAFAVLPVNRCRCEVRRSCCNRGLGGDGWC